MSKQTKMIDDAVCYCVVALYLILLILSLVGIRINRQKRSSLLKESPSDKYIRNKGAIAWRFRFFLFICLAVICRIASLIVSIVNNQPFRLSCVDKGKYEKYQAIATIPSLLFFSGFTCIAWFFAHMSFYKNIKLRRIITPFFASINVMLYAVIIVLIITSYITNNYYLVYYVGNPLYGICDYLLSFCFIFFGWKIKRNVRNEEIKSKEEYNEKIRRRSSVYGNSGPPGVPGLVGSGVSSGVSNNNISGISGIGDDMVSITNDSYDNSLINPKSQHGVGSQFVEPHISEKRFFISRV